MTHKQKDKIKAIIGWTIFLAIAFFTLATNAGAWDLSVQGTAASYHTRADTPAGHPYNDFNPGAGIELLQPAGHWRYGITTLNYYNSVKRDSTLVAAIGKYCVGDAWHGCAGAFAGGVTGYTTKLIQPIAAPIIEGGYKDISIEVTTFPTSDLKAEVFTGILKYKVWSF